MKPAVRSERRNERGAVALEYILIAALVAIALISTFVYFRDSLTKSTKAVADTTTNVVQSSIKTGTTTEEGKAVTAGEIK